MRSDLIDIEVEVVTETDKAILVSSGNGVTAWVPKSACECERENTSRGTTWTLTLRESLALEKGLI